ncbi:mechanosensitive ion channel family protein [Halodesulfurarchaeum formicicum]|uniref:mechanosensitive ion channel family protein n=1 Tax=Halodesulfurarchaeum formicicum TaxID=1873524 RepID=UPI0008782E96|nr:mechanosensitive ion channel family protein [Halodesulfurarchaeum formicicum]
MIGAPLAVGPVGSALDGMGIPFAAPIGSAISFLVVFLIIYTLGKVLIQPLISRGMDRRELDAHARTPIRRLTSGIIVFVAIAAAFGAAGFTGFLQSLATIAAAGTLAIGFALQDVIKNFVAGVFIYTDRPFRIGDWIEWDGHSGVVEDISLRVSRIRTFDNELLTVPNSQLTDGVIKNPVDGDKLRRTFVFGIGYEDDIEEATEIILDEATAHDGIMDEPGPSVRVTSLDDSSVGLQARIWIEDPSRADFVKVQSEFVKSTKEALDAAGIDIPYPQRVLHGDLSVEESALAD